MPLQQQLLNPKNPSDWVMIAMPTVFIQSGIRFVVWPNDHAPPHAHAIGAGWEIKVGLGDGQHRKPWLIEVTGLPARRELRRVLQTVDDHRITLEQAWRKLHGKPTP